MSKAPDGRQGERKIKEARCPKRLSILLLYTLRLYICVQVFDAHDGYLSHCFFSIYKNVFFFFHFSPSKKEIEEVFFPFKKETSIMRELTVFFLGSGGEREVYIYIYKAKEIEKEKKAE